MLQEILMFKNSKEWIEFERYYNSTNFMQQIGFFRYEDANTNFFGICIRRIKRLRFLINLNVYYNNC